MINIDTLHWELEHERQVNKIDDTNRKSNPYKELIANNNEKIEPLLAQMEQWSILSSMLNYIKYDRHPKNFHNLGISAVNKCKNHSDLKEERDITKLDFGPRPNTLKEEYLDVNKGIQLEIVNTTRIDENSDLSTTYLGNSDSSKMINLKQKSLFPYQSKGTH